MVVLHAICIVFAHTRTAFTHTFAYVLHCHCLGLVSTFLLIAGVTGAHLSSTDILLTALSGTIAGAISMAAGEYYCTINVYNVLSSPLAFLSSHSL
jgi:VIT1/CCC1 family predicted Fe2+/Mn2+ transporter